MSGCFGIDPAAVVVTIVLPVVYVALWKWARRKPRLEQGDKDAS